MDETDGAAVLAAVNRVLQRREYFRERKRKSRQREREEMEELKHQMTQMKTLVEVLKKSNCAIINPVDPDGMLSWHTIASVFRKESQNALSDNQGLRKKCYDIVRLSEALTKWIQECQTIHITPRHKLVWQHVSLDRNPEVRRLEKEWASQQMYHNTNAVFEQFPSVPMDNEYFDFEIEVEDNWVHVVDRSQFVWKTPMEVVVYTMRYHMHELSTDDRSTLPKESTENSILYYSPTKSGEISVALQAVFHEADRCVIVLRQIQQDKEIESHHAEDYGMTWIDIRKIDDTRTVMRSTSLATIKVKQNGREDLRAFAKEIGIDVNDVDEDVPFEDVFTARSRESSMKEDLELRTRIQTILDRVQQDISTLVVSED